jgi:diguanylate cyclase (GGDEF)-like protein/PAS domain S-box-containing protein
MSDAVVFLDNTGRIMLWNRGAERLTGISAHSVNQQLWQPSLVKLQDEQGRIVRDEDCPVSAAIHTGVQWIRRFVVAGRGGREVSVNAHAVPVVGSDAMIHGLTLLMHDVSPEISLEQRCRSLHELATKDPLTQVANRAEFDRVHELFVAAHRESDRPCALIMADIDRFKKVNDTYGHQAGDAVIQTFARLLQNACHPGDLVARYGGEEFVMLCADCDNTTAARRAEETRLQLSETRQAAIDGNSATASFGVTEIQPGDTTDTMLRRADRALMMSKQTGRNRVTQLGSGGDGGSNLPDAAETRQRGHAGQALIIQDLVTDSPTDRTIEKLRGFIADHHGDISSIDAQHVRIKLGGDSSFFRRQGERQIRLLMDLRFEEEGGSPSSERRTTRARTKIRVEINTLKGRDRRHSDAIARARNLLISLRAYLMATELAPKVEADTDPEPKEGGGLWRFMPFFGNARGGQPADDR